MEYSESKHITTTIPAQLQRKKRGECGIIDGMSKRLPIKSLYNEGFLHRIDN